MIDKGRLAEISRIKGLSLGNTEKDYLLDLALFIISKNINNVLVFKGGTALYKFYGLDRFSEDLDFTARKEFNVDLLLDKMHSSLKHFGIESEMRELKKVHNSVSAVIRTKGPLYTGNQNTLSKIQVDINFKSTLTKQSPILKHISLYQEISAFDLPVMDLEEIFAEKIRAIMTRNKARDLYDLWFLIKKGVSTTREFIQEKLDYYDEKYSKQKLIESINSKQKIWDMEMRHLLKEVTPFSVIASDVIKEVSTI